MKEKEKNVNTLSENFKRSY